MVKPKQPQPHPRRKEITFTFVLADLVLLLLLYFDNSVLGLLVSAVAAMASLILTGIVIQRVNGVPGTSGLYIFGGTGSIPIITRLAKGKEGIWLFMTEVGFVMSFGLLSKLVFKKEIRWSAFVVGMALILILLFVVYPYTSLVLKYIKIPNSASFGNPQPTLLEPLTTLGYIVYGMTIIGGFALFMVTLLVVGGGEILYSLIPVATSPSVSSNAILTVLSKQVPGAEPVIPGITIPLIAGILALGVLLMSHEFSHGALATIYKTKIKKVGLVMFGIIPVGAFVEPDEKQLKKLKKNKQNRVLIAGVTANFLLTFVFFILTFIMYSYVGNGVYVTQVIITQSVPGSPAASIPILASVLISWNGQSINNLTELQQIAAQDAPFSTVNLVTSLGTYSVQANATGKIGVDLMQQSIPVNSGPYYDLVQFLYQFVVLSFALNFLVATINLLPIPSFDGWQIYKNFIKDKRKLHLMGWLIVVLIIILALPWIPWLVGF